LLGFPLRFDETAVDNGAIDWSRRNRCLDEPGGFGCPDNETGYIGLTPQESFDAIRELGELGPERTVVVVPHPRDGFFGYFDQYGLNQFDLRFDPVGMIRGENPLLTSFPQDAPMRDRFRLYSENFDAIELFNGARFEMIRTATVGEVNDFVDALTAVRQGAAGDEAYAVGMAAVHDAAVRQILVRTGAEQAMLRYGLPLECYDHDDCAEGELCDPNRAQCVTDSGTSCSFSDPCADGEACYPAVVPGASRCLAACEGDHHCRLDSFCNVATGTCERAACNVDESGSVLPEGDRRENPDRPCVRNREPQAAGVVDDWFRLLNYGVAYTGMGNSDTHTTSTEIGLPRTFVESSVDAPAQVDHGEISDNIRAARVVASYGPFVEVFIDEGSIGDTITSGAEVLEIHVRAQSPSWFDVDRIEIYGNAELVCDLGYGSTEASRCDTTASLAVGANGRNTDIVNFDGVIRHRVDSERRDAWYAVIVMGVSPEARGLSPVYFASLHPQLGFSQVIGQAFASFDVDLLRGVVPVPLDLAQITGLVPYAITNPIWVDHDGDGRWSPPMGIPGYRREIPCELSQPGAQGCQDVPVMPLSARSLGIDRQPLEIDDQDEATRRVRRVGMIQQALRRIVGGGC